MLALYFNSCTYASRKEQESDSIVSRGDSLSLCHNSRPEKKSVYDAYREVFGKYYRMNYQDLPDWLGGIVNADKYSFTVYIVGNKSKGRTELEKLLGRSDFNVKSGFYSYKHLRLVNDSLFLFFKDKDNDLISKEIGFRFFSLQEKENCIYVYLEKYDNNKIKNFRDFIIDDSCIVFKQYIDDPNASIVAD